MKCYCGAEIRPGAEYCRECGRPVRTKSNATGPASQNTSENGGSRAPVRDPAADQMAAGPVPQSPPQKIRSNRVPLSEEATQGYGYYARSVYSGARVKTPENNGIICPMCGTRVPSGITVCQNCGNNLAGEPQKQPEYDPPNNKRLKKEPAVQGYGRSGENRSRAGSAHADGQAFINERRKKAWLIGLAVGFYILVLGLAGKVMMVKLTAEIQQYEYFTERNEEIGGIIDRNINKALTDMVLALIRNDPSRYVDAVSKMTETGFSIAGDTYGLGELGGWITGTLASTAFDELRNELKSEAGFRWPFYVVMTYYRIFLTVGGILLLIFGVLFFISGGRMSDVIRMKLQPLLIGAAVWAAFLFIVALIL